MAEAIIQFKSVSKSYQMGGSTAKILREADFEVEQGEFVAVVGTSGSGKSTLLNIIGGLDRIYRGEVKVTGQDLARLSDSQISNLRNEKVGFIFQHFNLLEHLSCLENVALPSMFSRRAVADSLSRARAALERVGMAQRADALPGNLSGGQKQRVAIARALFNNPPLLLCDEPTGNLDAKTGQQIIDLFRALNEEEQITLIIVTHESRVSVAAHRILQLEEGRLGPIQGTFGVEGPRAAEG